MAETKYIGSFSRASLLVMEHALFLQTAAIEHIEKTFETEVPEPFDIRTADDVRVAREIIDAAEAGTQGDLLQLIAQQFMELRAEQEASMEAQAPQIEGEI